MTVARAVRRRPLAVLVSAAALLLVAAAPFLGVRYAEPDAKSLPATAASRQLAELVDTRFESSADVDPVTVVARGSIPEPQLSAYVEQLRSLSDVRDVTIRQGVPGLTVIDVSPHGESQGRQPLFLFTGSVVLPLKAIVMNLVSLGASFGALVWVFQEGHLGGLVGTEALRSLSITTPVLVFAIAFGLSMDYEVFLLGRIAETYRHTRDSDLAVERGLQHTGGIITAAGLLMVVVSAGFVAGGFSPVKQVGLGLVLAVAVDVTIVRMLLVPAVMTLMADRNWWSPRPLRTLHARFGLFEHGGLPAPRTPAESPATASV